MSPGTTEHEPLWIEEALARDDIHYFAIERDGRLVGQILLHDANPDWTEALIAYHIFQRRDRGRGTGTAALTLLKDFIVAETHLRRVVAIASAENAASRRIAEKAGFRYAGAPREDPTGVVMEWVVPTAARGIDAGSGRLPTLWIHGPCGVGKTTIAWDILRYLRRVGIRAGYVDIANWASATPHVRKIPSVTCSKHETSAPW